MGTTDTIFVLHSVIQHLLNKKKKLFVAFIDFTKAFDYVVRDILWYKLIKLGIRGKLLNIIRSMYSIVKSRVKYDNEVSDSFTCMVGVRQGESLSPFLFAMYLNDIEEYLLTNNYDGISLDTLKLFIMLYADDIMVFKKGGRLRQNIRFLYDNNVLEIVDKFTYLGFVFSSGAHFPKHLIACVGNL